MLSQVHPILPMRDKQETVSFYVEKLGFHSLDPENKWERYLMVRKDNVELHFSLNQDLIPGKNDCSCYIRTDNVEHWYKLAKEQQLDIEKELQDYPWMQKEFVIKDPNHNYIVFGDCI
jgi:uncharacterized glyoxalase superfamily protein PhnB